MLNLQGRVVFDLLISPDSSHHTGEGYLVDCDARMSDRLVKHLKMFKLRKDVAVERAADRKVHAMFKENWKDGEDGASGKSINQSSVEDLYGVQVNSINQASIDTHAGMTRDPRLGLLGYRSIVASLKQTESGSSSLADEMEYRKFRYQLGVPEGSLELPPGECFPLESNADYLSGVHFHKGCYLGQELTARTHHTGVVRKRLMPIVIEGLPSGATLERDSAITVPGASKSVGKLRAHSGEYGLALLRISEALAAADGLEVSWEGKRFAVHTEKPRWWPEPDWVDFCWLVSSCCVSFSVLCVLCTGDFLIFYCVLLRLEEFSSTLVIVMKPIREIKTNSRNLCASTHARSFCRGTIRFSRLNWTKPRSDDFLLPVKSETVKKIITLTFCLGWEWITGRLLGTGSILQCCCRDCTSLILHWKYRIICGI